METCLGELHLQWCIIYLDVIIIFTKRPKEHVTRLRAVFEKLADAGLKLKPSKCKFFKRWIACLGHIISKDGVETDPKKIKAIVNWPTPSTVTDVCSFLVFTNHYRRFIHKYANITWPLNLLISGDNANKKQTLKWNEDCGESFKKLKQLCSSTCILACADYSKPFKLYTDSCSLGLGEVLYQTGEDGLDRVIAYASRTLSNLERNYPAYKLEFLVLKWAVRDQFHEYLYGGNFNVYTDNNPPMYILTWAKLDAVGQCWVAAWASYNFQLHYKTCNSNVEADALLHIPWQQAGLECLDLDSKMVKAIIAGCTAETSLFEANSGKTVQAKGFQVIPSQEDTLLLGKVEVNQNSSITKQEWIKQQSQDKTIAEIRDLLQSKKLS